jgi:hypothetical protein
MVLQVHSKTSAFETAPSPVFFERLLDQQLTGSNRPIVTHEQFHG